MQHTGSSAGTHPNRAFRLGRLALIIVPATRGDFSHGRTRKTLKKKESSVCFRVFPWPRVGMMIKGLFLSLLIAGGGALALIFWLEQRRHAA